jgi:hypothetical protein
MTKREIKKEIPRGSEYAYTDLLKPVGLPEAEEVKHKVKSVISLARTKYNMPNLKEPDISFFRYGTRVAQVSAISLAISLEALLLYKDVVVDDVVPHEIAHYIRINTAGDYGHSPEWRELAKELGSSGKRQHAMGLTALDRVYPTQKKPLSKDLLDALNEL